MSIYGIVLDEPSEDAWAALADKWPGRHFILDERLAFVAPEGISLTSDPAKVVGMHPDGKVWGVVLEVATYTGFNRRELWEWFSKVES